MGRSSDSSAPNGCYATEQVASKATLPPHRETRALSQISGNSIINCVSWINLSKLNRFHVLLLVDGARCIFAGLVVATVHSVAVVVVLSNFKKNYCCLLFTFIGSIWTIGDAILNSLERNANAWVIFARHVSQRVARGRWTCEVGTDTNVNKLLLMYCSVHVLLEHNALSW